MTPTRTVPKGEQTATGVIKFLKSAYPNHLATGTAVVSISTDPEGFLVADPGTLELRIKGTKVPTASVSATTTLIELGGSDQIGTYSINLSEPLEKDVVFSITAESDKEHCCRPAPPTVTINKGQIYALGTIIFYLHAFMYNTDKATVILKIASTDVFVPNSMSTITFEVSGTEENPNNP